MQPHRPWGRLCLGDLQNIDKDNRGYIVKKLLILILLMWSVVSMRPCSLARAQEEDYSFSYWASLKGHYSPGKCTDGDDFLSEKGRLNNPKRRIRCLRIAYRGPESLDSYRSAVKRALQMAKERDQTHGMKNDNNVNGNFDLASSDLVGAGKKVILAWGDELNGNSGFVVVHKVSDGRLEVMPQDGSLLTCGGGEPQVRGLLPHRELYRRGEFDQEAEARFLQPAGDTDGPEEQDHDGEHVEPRGRHRLFLLVQGPAALRLLRERQP